MNKQNEDMFLVREAVARALQACSCDLTSGGCKKCSDAFYATMRISALIDSTVQVNDMQLGTSLTMKG
jgi:hypothetical protein